MQDQDYKLFYVCLVLTGVSLLFNLVTYCRFNTRLNRHDTRLHEMEKTKVEDDMPGQPFGLYYQKARTPILGLDSPLATGSNRSSSHAELTEEDESIFKQFEVAPQV